MREREPQDAKELRTMSVWHQSRALPKATNERRNSDKVYA